MVKIRLRAKMRWSILLLKTPPHVNLQIALLQKPTIYETKFSFHKKKPSQRTFEVWKVILFLFFCRREIKDLYLPNWGCYTTYCSEITGWKNSYTWQHHTSIHWAKSVCPTLQHTFPLLRTEYFLWVLLYPESPLWFYGLHRKERQSVNEISISNDMLATFCFSQEQGWSNYLTKINALNTPHPSTAFELEHNVDSKTLPVWFIITLSKIKKFFRFYTTFFYTTRFFSALPDNFSVPFSRTLIIQCYILVINYEYHFFY